MRQSLQSKFNALGILFLVFFLFMLPMFTQVKADARESAKEWKSTLLSGAFRDVVRNFKPEDLGDEEIEDYWAKYGEEAKRQDPNCGADCDPNADRDGDGVSNKDEVKNGTNPSCNEKEKGDDYCRGINPYAPPDPENETKPAVIEHIANLTWSYGAANCGSGLFQGSCTELTASLQRNYTQVLLYFNATNYQGTGWRLSVFPPSGGIAWSRAGNPQNQAPQGQATLQPTQSLDWAGVNSPATTGTLRANIQLPNGATQSGTWELAIYGVVS